MADTWDYRVSEDPESIPAEWVWERLRNRRNALIAQCDWRMVSDAPWDVAPWTAYRRGLRDLPDTTADPRRAIWPISPQ